VWGASATLGAQSTLLNTATRPQGDDISGTAVDLISGRDFDAAAALADDGIRFVLLASNDREKDRARTMREEATTAIDQRAGFVKAGETVRGMLWRVDVPIAARAQPSALDRTIGSTVALAQLIILFAALLLAIPTRASRRASRARSRVVGRSSEEPRVRSRRSRRKDRADELAAAAAEPDPVADDVAESAPEPDPAEEAPDADPEPEDQRAAPDEDRVDPQPDGETEEAR
jgi:hypothetical protein